MALRRPLGWSEGELMRSDAKPCSRLMRQTAAIFSVGGGLAFWVLCRLHYGPRITVPRSLRSLNCGTEVPAREQKRLVFKNPSLSTVSANCYEEGKLDDLLHKLGGSMKSAKASNGELLE